MSKRAELAEAIRLHTTDAHWTPEGLADAVLDALMEPTSEMLDAGNEKMNWGPNGVSEVWGNMIQAAKEDK